VTRAAGRDHRASPPGLRTREVRDRALFDLDDGPVTPSNHGDLAAMTHLLNALLASLVVSSLQYEQHAQLLRAPSARPLADFLYACADRDRDGARLLATRIGQLGSAGGYDPEHLSARSRISFRAFPDEELRGIVTQHLVGARILVQTMQEAVRWISDDDPTTRRLLERLLAEKEAEADELSAQCPPQQAPTAHP